MILEIDNNYNQGKKRESNWVSKTWHKRSSVLAFCPPEDRLGQGQLGVGQVPSKYHFNFTISSPHKGNYKVWYAASKYHWDRKILDSNS